MGLRGPGARPRKQADDAPPPKRAKKQPWEKKGLTRWRRVVAFLESLPITKGMLEGKTMQLLPKQRAFVKELYGRLDKKGRRIIRIAIFSEPAGNGKTGFTAGLQLCHLLGPEAEPRGECDAAAVDRTMSSKMFDEIEAIILEKPELKARVNIKRHEKTIEVLDGPGKGSKFQAMSGDARKGHGLAPSLWTYDELAQVRDRALLDNLIARMGKRNEALGIIISTQADTDDHPLSELIDDGLAGNDKSLYVLLIATPEDADVFDWKQVQRVNEALGIFLNETDVRNDMRRAKRLPGWESKYRNERHNQRVAASSTARICTKEVWALGAVPIDINRLRRRRCFGALDLSGKHDLTSLTLAFADDAPEPCFDLLPFFWTPADQLAQRKPREQELFKRWIADEHLITVPGPTIRYSFVAAKLAELGALYEIVLLGYDPWRIDDFKQELQEIGCDINLVAFAQGFKAMSPAIDLFAELALTGRIRHGAHPVLSACIANAIFAYNTSGERMFAKDKANESATVRIDGAVTACMALYLASRGAEPKGPDLGALIDAGGGVY